MATAARATISATCRAAFPALRRAGRAARPVWRVEALSRPVLWRYRNLAATWGTTAAREQRIYTGARLWGEIGRVTIDWTVNHQGGYQNARPIDAWQAFLAQTWRLGKDARAPRLGIHADYASGGGAFRGASCAMRSRRSGTISITATACS
jgi:hypothetical protein